MIKLTKESRFIRKFYSNRLFLLGLCMNQSWQGYIVAYMTPKPETLLKIKVQGFLMLIVHMSLPYQHLNQEQPFAGSAARLTAPVSVVLFTSITAGQF